MRKYMKSFVIIAITLTLTGSAAFAMQPQTDGNDTNVGTKAEVTEPPKEKKIDLEVVNTPEPTPEVVETPIPSVTPVPVTPSAPVSDNETIVWNYLIGQGFNRNQTAGIMGNLQQEHNFRTDGDGLAQWTDNRKANLMAKPNWQDINVQLNFLMEELQGGEHLAYNAIKVSSSVESATMAFQNQFERCNPFYCNGGNRVQYAYAILARH